MTQILKDSIKIEYKLDQVTPISKYEMNAYNVPFAGNTSMCREVFVKGERKLEFSIDGDMSLSQIMQKPVFRDELVEYIFSISKQLVSVIQNGLALENVVWDTNYMYVRFSDFSIQLLYLPFESKFDKKDIGEFVKSILLGFVYAHTPAIECANQIVDYFNDHREFDAFHFNEFVSDLRASSQLLIIQGEKGKSKVLTSNENNKELAIHKAEEAARKAEEARMQAENEVKRQIEEAKYQAEVARQAEETRMKAEAARVEAEIWRQKVTAEAKDYEQTAVLTAQDMYSYQGNSDDSERLKAEEMFRNAEEEPPTTLFSNRTLVTGSKPTLTRKTTGESVQINKQVFCIGKADQGVDYKVTGNKSISRRHAYITSINGTHYLRDNNSTNHTFLNGTQVYSNVDVAIPDNSVIRLSNEEFIFRINS